MKGNVRQTVLKLCSLPPDRLIFSDPKTLQVSSIDRGVIVIFAIWSGPSHIGWRELSRILSNHAGLQFVVHLVDADEVTAEFVNQLSVIPHGNGEAYWVRGGRIVHVWSVKTGPLEEIDRFTAEAFR